MADKRGHLFVISGPAGAGKSMIVKRLLEKYPDVGVSVSCTTRAPRPGEVEGVNYYFVTEEKFDQIIAEDGFYEWAHVHQNRYGTPVGPVQKRIEAGEVEKAYKYHYTIIHQDWNDVPDALEIAVEEVYSIIRAKRCETKVRVGFLDELTGSLKK